MDALKYEQPEKSSSLEMARGKECTSAVVPWAIDRTRPPAYSWPLPRHLLPVLTKMFHPAGQPSGVMAKRTTAFRSIEGPSPERGSGQDRFRHMMAGRPFVPGSTTKSTSILRPVNSTAPVPTQAPGSTQAPVLAVAPPPAHAPALAQYASFPSFPSFPNLMAKQANEPPAYQTEPRRFGKNRILRPLQTFGLER